MTDIIIKFVFYTALLWFVAMWVTRSNVHEWYGYFLLVAIEMGIGSSANYLGSQFGSFSAIGLLIGFLGFGARYTALWILLSIRLQVDKKRITYTVLLYIASKFVVHMALSFIM